MVSLSNHLQRSITPQCNELRWAVAIVGGCPSGFAGRPQMVRQAHHDNSEGLRVASRERPLARSARRAVHRRLRPYSSRHLCPTGMSWHLNGLLSRLLPDFAQREVQVNDDVVGVAQADLVLVGEG